MSDKFASDFTPVVWTKNTPHTPTVVEKQHTRAVTSISTNFKNLDSDDPVPIAKPSLSFRLELQRARCEKKMTQEDLARAINTTLSVVKSLEAGTSVVSPAILAKINRVLGSSLKKDM